MPRPHFSEDLHPESHSSTGISGTAAKLSAKALLGNFEAIQRQVPDHSILPMIKADAYGHGIAWVARQLMHEPGLYGFGLATLGEAVHLRKELGARGKRVRLIVFSGGAPWSDEKGELCEKHGLTPVIASDRDWASFLRGGWTDRVGYELKFNTGMNRLGISPSMAPQIRKALASRGSVHHPSGVFSHMAMGESPEAKLSLSQKEKFIAIRSELAGALPAAHFHMANSATIWNAKNWGLSGLTDVVRPGLALYGIPPWKGAPVRGLVPVMEFGAQVIHRFRLKPGESVGYGATFKAVGKPVEVAILAAGYADGVHRALSNRGWVGIREQRCRILGRVSMDLTAVECPDSTRVGEWAYFLGPGIDPWEQAEAGGTIPYELLTSVSGRVKRIYG